MIEQINDANIVYFIGILVRIAVDEGIDYTLDEFQVGGTGSFSFGKFLAENPLLLTERVKSRKFCRIRIMNGYKICLKLIKK